VGAVVGWGANSIDEGEGLGLRRGLSGELCVVWVTDSALVAGKDADDDEDHQE